MDLATMIVDILRRKKEEEALNQGGLVAGTQAAQRAVSPRVPMQRGIEPKHGGKTYDQVLAEMGG